MHSAIFGNRNDAMTQKHFGQLLLVLFSWASWSSVVVCVNGMVVKGVRHTCDNEGEEMHLDVGIDKQRCYVCICRNGYVECDRNPVCPEIRGCHLIERVEKHCCARCKGCIHNGTYYASGDEWTSSEDACRTHHCEAGVITSSQMRCHVPCDNPLPPAEGQCCATCPDCRVDGYIATDDRDLTSGDLCVQCRCVRGALVCQKKVCPVLQCAEHVQTDGECCPTCVGNRERLHVPHACVLGNRLYLEAQSIAVDTCTRCTCTNQTSICERENCQLLECPPHLQRKTPGGCCKECIADDDYDETAIAEVQTKCVLNGREYQEGHTWSLDSCTTCVCQGKVICMKTTCNESLSCPIGSHLVQQSNECCKRCVDDKVEATCVAFGDPHYRTFDGKMYHFRGLGKYQFVSDCTNHTFSVRVTNDFSDRSKSSTMTKRVRIKIGDSRINLGQNCRVRLNGERLLPTTEASSDPLITVERHPHEVHVTLNQSIRVLWDCRSYLEVSVTNSYKNRLCGLCGNFNFNVQDELRTRKGALLGDHEIMEFAASWCVGKECAQALKQSQQIRACKQRTPRSKACALLTFADIFSDCHRKLSYKKYYAACVTDMCDCPSGTCYCDSLTAYAHECRRLGVEMPNWRHKVFCDHQQAPKATRRPHANKMRDALAFSEFNHNDYVRLPQNYKKKGNVPIIH